MLWGTARRSRIDLSDTVIKVCVSGDRGRGQGGLQDEATMWRIGSRDRGVNSRGAAPVAAAQPGGGLGVSPN